MRKVLPFIVACVFVACGTDSVVGPTSKGEQTPASVAVSTPPAAVPPVSTDGVSFEGKILPNGGFTVTNLASSTAVFTAYYTDFNDQSKPLGSKTAIRATGDTWTDSFNKTCIQVDITHGAPGGTPFLAGFIAKDGSVFNPSYGADKVAECRVPDPVPTPTPAPTPTPTPTPTPSPSPSPSPTPPPPCMSDDCGPVIGTCHVSNKGNDGANNNLQFDWKRNGEGHEKHTCPKFNPPDFKSTEADCNIKNVKFCEVS